MLSAAALARFLNAVSNLKLIYGHPDVLDHDGAETFYGLTVVLAVATGLLGPTLTARDIAHLMLIVSDALEGEFDAYAHCFEDEAGPAGCAGSAGHLVGVPSHCAATIELPARAGC
jgi:hypothetical protein